LRRIIAFSSTRADYGLLKPILKRISDSPGLELIMVASGDHLASYKGGTISDIKKDGFAVAETVPFTLDSDNHESIAKSLGEATVKMAAVIGKYKPDFLLLLGDRYELLAPASCALIYRVPLAHIAGGESTEGALDEQVRHALTKMAHLHFASTWEYGRRIRQMGEEAWRIHVVGSTGIENIYSCDYLSPSEIKNNFGIDPETPTLLITFHPETITGENDTEAQAKEVALALEQFQEYQQVITYPGLEAGYQAVVQIWQDYALNKNNVLLKPSLGSRGYLGLMRIASAVVGNSSSGIIEAPSFHVPTVNIGNRQKGRIRAESILDVNCRKKDIVKGLRKALTDPVFRAGLLQTVNPYDPFQDGKASEKIISVLEQIPLGRTLLEKRLDFPGPDEVSL